MPTKRPSAALVIDANALVHRAWHALPPLTSPDGKLVNAVYGFALVLTKLLQHTEPSYLAVCWDTPEPTYRHKAAPEYKAQRAEQPQEFYNQIPLVKEVVTAFGGTNVELPGYEADDLLGTIATKLAKKGTDVTILTSDKDAFQLIGERIRVLAFKKGVSETITYDEKALREVMGLAPEQIAPFKALRGDASDNLKGVPGIGEKTATELLQSFETLKGIFKAAHDAKSDLSPSVRQKLLAGEQAAYATLPLVELQLDAPLPVSLDELVYRGQNSSALREIFLRHGFKSLVGRMSATPTDKNVDELKQRSADASETSADTTKRRRASAESREESVDVPTAAPATVDDVLSVLADAEREGILYLHTATLSQGSLFGERRELAIGTTKKSVLVGQSVLADTKVRGAFANVIANVDVKKVGHGLKADWHWLSRQGLDLVGIGFDTELASYLLSAGEGGHELESQAASRLGLTLPEGEAGLAASIGAIRELHVQLERELQQEKLAHILTRFELPLIPILGRMEREGVLIDREYFATLTEDFRAEKKRIESEMMKLAGEDFNPGSPTQLAHVLFDVLKLPVKGIKRGKTGLSTAASELEKLEGAHPIIEKIGEYREVSKLLSTYVETLPTQADVHGRVHTTYVQIGAATGRMASTNPNLQNIPIRTELGRKIRRGFIASKGCVLLSCDYSQIELRVIAALAKDEAMLDAFRRNIDIHTATASAIWHIPLDEVTKDQRRAAKAFNFGIIYGQGPQGLAKAAGIPYQEARQFIDEYFHAYAGVREYLDQTKALAHARGFVETLFGRRRPIPEINSPLPQLRAAAERMAINMPVQGTATGDLIKLALIALNEKLPKQFSDTRMLLQVHDELVFEVPMKDAERVASFVRDVMEHVAQIGCPIVAESKAGKNWEEMEKM
jgi:DNA polymerase-1